MNTALKYLYMTLPPLCIVIVICYFFIDKSLAIYLQQLHFFSHPHILQHDWALWLTQLLYCLMLPFYALYFLLTCKAYDSHGFRCLGLFNCSIALTFFIKSALQFLFGRYAPRYSNSNVLLFIHNSKWYGLHWLHNGGSFPSGHMAMFSAGFCAICVYYPKMKWPSIVLLAILAFLLLALNYHFISDVIAGIYLGISLTLALHFLFKLKQTAIAREHLASN